MTSTTLREATRAARPWLHGLATFGYASKGAVYTLIGFLTVAAALGKRGRAGDPRAAIDFVLRQPFGRVLLLLLAVGLGGYALFRIISTFADADGRGSDIKGLAFRTGSLIRGMFYGVFAWEVARLMMSGKRGPAGSDAKARHWTAQAMDQPYGRWLVAIGGASIIGYAAYQIYKAWRGKLTSQIRLDRIPPDARPRMVFISRFGIIARGIVFLIVGWSVVTAAVRYNPRAATGLSGALREIAEKPFGSVLLFIAGIGLAAYGVYAFLSGKYRHISI